mmetsp:Transcript_26879/g.43878  ORF Transcript_26879/g.43878 Transcript_26879/m.43878 type:complete len:202 (+) Transcript_26879:664-1269(+)
MNRIRTAADLPSSKARLAALATITGVDGGHDLSMRTLAAKGAILLGHVDDVKEGDVLLLKDDLMSNVNFSIEVKKTIRKQVDTLIDTYKLDADPPIDESLLAIEDALDETIVPVSQISLTEKDINTVIWANGFKMDWSFIDSTALRGVFDQDNLPVCEVSESLGLFFVGVPWLRSMYSALIVGASLEAEAIAEKIHMRHPD